MSDLRVIPNRSANRACRHCVFHPRLKGFSRCDVRRDFAGPGGSFPEAVTIAASRVREARGVVLKRRVGRGSRALDRPRGDPGEASIRPGQMPTLGQRRVAVAPYPGDGGNTVPLRSRSSRRPRRHSHPDRLARRRRWRGLPDAAWKCLRGADAILHAGDILDAGVLELLGELAPVHAVLGNNDVSLVGVLPISRVVELGGVRIGMVHDTGAATGRAARMRRRFPTRM